jgi:hypothetical protein
MGLPSLPVLPELLVDVLVLQSSRNKLMTMTKQVFAIYHKVSGWLMTQHNNAILLSAVSQPNMTKHNRAAKEVVKKFSGIGILLIYICAMYKSISGSINIIRGPRVVPLMCDRCQAICMHRGLNI